jgi:HD-GYP domain-containing protein (c-di-GMP phosphodiesterase class II)
MPKTTALNTSELIDFIAEKISSISDWRAGFCDLLNFMSNRLATGGGYVRLFNSYTGMYMESMASSRGRANSVIEGIFDHMAEDHKPVAVPADFANYLPGNMQYSIVGIPFSKSGKFLGGMVLAGSDGEGIRERQFQDLLAFAPYLLPLFESAVLQEILLSNYLDAVETLAVALEAKDPFTRGHSNMVCAYSVAIARKMGFSPERLRAVEIGSMMHDIGKIGIPDTILLKPGHLSKDEFEIVKRHPVIGEEILKPMQHPLFDIPRQIVRWHHERMDGKGYPDGLHGDQIPLEARITFVADAYEAMTSDRPYREALSPQQAFEELACNAGSQFDPDIVDVLCDLLSPLANTGFTTLENRLDDDDDDDGMGLGNGIDFEPGYRSGAAPGDDPFDDSYVEWDFSDRK